MLRAPGLIGRNVGGPAAPEVNRNAPLLVGEYLTPLDTPVADGTIVDLMPTVRCDQPHSAEVLAVGRIEAKARPTVADQIFATGALSRQCDQLAAQFLDVGSKSFRPRIQVSFCTRLTVPGALEWQFGQQLRGTYRRGRAV